MSIRTVPVWDLPTRLFHWSLVAVVVSAIVTGLIGGSLIDWHGRLGLAVVGLVVFRLVWGLVGSTYARFAQFFPTPRRLAAYLRGEWHKPGHNPLGALSVFALLALLAFQAGSGLFANDDIAFNGPLYPLIDKDLSDTLSSWHHLAVNVLYGLIGLHVAAIAFYARFKRHNLVVPMLTGRAEGEAGQAARGGGPLAFVLALALALLAVYGASAAWYQPPPPPPSAPADW